MTGWYAPSLKSLGARRRVMVVKIMCASLVCMTAFSRADVAPTVQLEFFWAKDCPHCEAVKDLINIFHQRYHIKVREVNVDTQKGYSELVRVGRRFRKDPPAVPLIVISGQVLMGEAEIKATLEQKIDSLIHRGHASSRAAKRQKMRDAAGPQKSTHNNTVSSSENPQTHTGKMKVTSDE